MKIGFLHEHPTWSDALIACFARNGIEIIPVNVAEAAFGTDRPDFDFCINRVNIMPSQTRDPAVAAQTLHLLNWLEVSGVQVMNGFRTHSAGASKAVQNGIFAKLGLDFPSAIAIYRPEDAPAAAKRIGYPVIIKPNIGGSGSGIARFDSAGELSSAVEKGSLDLGIDGTGLVQEYIWSDGYVYRVEVLGDELFYGIRQKSIENQFNYCAADGCSVDLEDGEGRIAPHEVPDAILRNVVSICREAGADFGGVEYFIRADNGSACFYDFNPYSNFVGEGEAMFGFSPEQRFVEFVVSHFANRR